MPNRTGTVVEQYLVKVTPYIDAKAYDRMMKSLENKIKGGKSGSGNKDSAKTTFTKSLFNKRSGTLDSVKKLSKNMTTVAKKGADFNISMGKMGGSLTTALAAFKAIYEIMNKLVNKAAEFSNKMITSSSAFIDKDVRNLMARFGVSGQTATGIQSVTGLMGISPEDLKLMTPGQMELFFILMSEWNEGMSSIDPKALDKYNEVLQNFQSEMASAKLQLQIQLYKMLIELTPALETAGNAIVSLFKSLGKILEHPAIKMGIKVLASALEALAEVVDIFLSIIGYGWLWGGESSNIESTKSAGSANYTTNNVTVNAQSTNQFMGSNSTMFDLATNVSQNNSQMIQQQYLKTGRA